MKRLLQMAQLTPLGTLTPLALAACLVLHAQAQTLPPLNSDTSRSPSPSPLEQSRFAAAIGQVATLEIKADRDGIPANGRDAIVLTIRVLDRAGNPVVGDVPLSLEASRGRFVDLSAQDPLAAAVDREFAVAGNQAVAKNGVLTIKLQSPGEPGQGQVRVSVGSKQSTLDVTFVPDLRELIAVGLIEGVINLSRSKGATVVSTRPSDGFEQELRNLSREFNDGKGAYGGRAAFFLKGRIQGQTLLTAAYDSDKDVRERLFRDIQPDEFYPVYGDASLKGFDAQSGSRLYVRLDNGQNYLLYGDFQTTDVQADDASQLGRYTRSLTGAQGQWVLEGKDIQNGKQDQRAKLRVFAAKDSLRQVVDEIPARGISGPYSLRFGNGVTGSERIEILVRDRNAPSIVLSSTLLVRFVDYDFEPFSGRVLLTAPLPSVDARLNPISIRATYEVEDGGPKYWVYGAEAKVQFNKNLTWGATFAKDENPLARYRLGSVSGTAKFGEATTATIELAESRGSAVTNFGFTADPAAFPAGAQITDAAKSGAAGRVEIRHDGSDLQARIYGQHTQAGFSNAGAGLGLGVGSARTEGGAKATLRLSDTWRVTGELLGQRDNATGGVREGAFAGLIWDASPALSAEFGVRHAEQRGAGATIPATGAAGLLPGSSINPSTGGSVLDPAATFTTGNQPYRSSSLRGKLTWRATERAQVFVEAEKAFSSTDNSGNASGDGHALAVGGEYVFDAPGSLAGRLYARSEWSRGLGGDYGLDGGSGRQAATVIGVDTPYMKDGQLFSEYRLRDAIGGREAVAAAGLRNVFKLGEGWRMNTAVERVKVLDGAAQEGKAIAVGLDYVGSEIWKGATRGEWRQDEANTTGTTTSWLHSIAIARKLNDDWTLLARNLLLKRDVEGASVVLPPTTLQPNGINTTNTATDSLENRFQIGAAWRETQTNVWSALGRYEYWLQRYGEGSGNELDESRKHIVSVDATYHPSRPWWVFGKVAGKWQSDQDACALDPNTGLVNICNSSRFKGGLLQGRLLYDITPRWDVGVMGSVLRTNLDRKYAVGVETGYLLAENLWLSVGYNHRGFTESDLADGTQQGVYLKLRFKFDEKLFQRDKRGLDRSVDPTQAGAVKP